MLGVGVSLSSLRSSVSGTAAFSPASLFASGEEGAWYEPSTTTCFTDTGGTTPATYGDGVAYLQDLSGNGNHATQVTAGARPILARVPEGGRRNLLEKTEQFDDAYWGKVGATVTANATTDPFGNSTAEKITTTDVNIGVFRTLTAPGTHTWSVYAKADTANFLLFRTSNVPEDTYFNLATGAVATSNANHTASIQSIGSGWYRCAVTANSTNNRFNIFPTDVDGDDTPTIGSSIFVWGAQLETGSTATAYQKVVDEYDITEAGVTSLEYLSFDGSDDGMATASIDFTATDKMSVFAGVEREQDTIAAVMAELSADAVNNNGAFFLAAPVNSTVRFRFLAGGTARPFVETTTGTAPQLAVVSGLSDIPGDNLILRVDGTQVDQSSTNQGTGNFGNYPLNIGARANASSLFFDGKLFSLIVRGASSTAPEITNTEAYLANRSGVVL